MTETISQIKSDECFKDEGERAYGFVRDRGRALRKHEVSFKNGNWYETESCKITKDHLKAGFGIIEVAIFFIIISTVFASMLPLFESSKKHQESKEKITKERLAKVNEEIRKYVLNYGRLPCPADQTMAESATKTVSVAKTVGFDDENTNSAGTCLANIGAIPTKALLLPDEYMLDGWGRRIRYHVASTLCGTTAGTCTTSTYSAGAGNITVVKSNNTVNVTTSAAYILVSFGDVGYGAYTTNGTLIPGTGNAYEDENIDTDNIYNQNKLNYEAATPFRHFLSYKHKNEFSADKPASGVISLSACQANSDMLGNINQNIASSVAGNLRYNISYLNRGSPVYHYADEAVLGIIWTLQEICYELYGASLTRKCPNSASVTYDPNHYTPCVCNSTLWSGSCLNN